MKEKETKSRYQRVAKKDIGEFVRKSEFLSTSQNNGVLEENKTKQKINKILKRADYMSK